jgi:NADPH:quinone reductase
MIAVAYDRPGDVSVLELRDLDTPEPEPGEVRVRLAVSGINPSDWKSRVHATYRGSDGGWQIPHHDGAGVIDAVGEGVDPARVGERVWVYSAAWQRPWGTAAQWTVLPAARAVPLPDRASLDLGASLGVPALTAYRCLTEAGPIAGQTVLVAGGAGAVGHFAIELGKHLGATVVTTVSGEEKARLATRAGADVVINYRTEDVSAEVRRHAPQGVTTVVEVSPASNLAIDLAVLAPGGSISTYATEQGTEITTAVRPLMDLNAHLHFVMIYRTPDPLLATAIAGVSEAVAAGALSELPAHRFALTETAAAQQALEDGLIGKVLVDVP